MNFNKLAIYTIGHGRHAWTDFLALLQKYEIAFLCDVRSAARSRWVQFNGAVLSANLRENGIGYEHLPEAGGKRMARTEDLDDKQKTDKIGNLIRELRVKKEIINTGTDGEPKWVSLRKINESLTREFTRD